MALQPNWKLRWTIISLLILPTIAWFTYALLNPQAHVQGEARFHLITESARQRSAAAREAWTMQLSGTTASLRGIYSVDGKVAWASGTAGTVLHTTDGGEHWKTCAIPDGATDGATLDLRGIQAWDAKNAVVMASGTGEKSRLFETTDGCRTWTLDLKEPEPTGFMDAVVFQHGNYGFLFGDDHTGVLVGDPVDGRFETSAMVLGKGWLRDLGGCEASKDEAAFAASNSSIFVFGSRRYILGTGGKPGASVLISPLMFNTEGLLPCTRVPVPIAGGNESSGIFSVSFRDLNHGVVAGGDYKLPDASSKTAAYTSDMGKHWTAATTPPHGYRSTVAWSESLKAWIAAGTNGSDISRDDGKTWQPLPDPSVEGGNWNAISLPFIVGPKGRIARLNAATLSPNP